MAAFLIKDILISNQLGIELPKTVALRARVVDLKTKRDRIFLKMVDPSGSMQAVADSSSGPDIVTRARQLEIGVRVDCEGWLDPKSFKERPSNKAVPTLVLTSLKDLAGPPRDIEAAQDSLDRYAMQAIYLARIRRAVSDAYASRDYVEVEPRFITLAAPVSGLEPLRLSYVGFGAPAHLYPSPARQLRDIISSTGINALFSISRIFTTTYRDEETSNEAVTAMGMRVLDRAKTSDGQPSHILELIKKLGSEPWLKPAASGLTFDLEGSVERAERTGYPKPLLETEQVTTLIHENFSSMRTTPAVEGSEIISFQRVIAPKRSIVAEQSFLRWYGGSALEVTTIHLERIVSLLPTLSLRALYDFRTTSNISLMTTTLDWVEQKKPQ